MLTQLLRDNCSHLRLHPPKADNFSTTTLVEATTLATLVLNSSNPQTLAHSLHSPAIQWTPQLVNAVLKCLWNHGPKALQFFNLLSHHPSYSHHASSFDHAIDISARLRDNRTVWALVSRMRSSRLGPSPKTFAIIAERSLCKIMPLSSSEAPESSCRHHTYSRKQKSLGLLCTNFLSFYDRGGVEVVGLDEAASKLGVERRRIYDIVNVLEGVGVLARKAKNKYTWKGFEAIPKALQELKEEGLRENLSSFDKHRSSNYEKVSYDDNDDEDECDSNPNTGSQNDNSIPSGIVKSTAASRFAKVRRLYDIANVLSSLKLIEKTHTAEARKPAFRWLGLRGKPESGSDDALAESRKRTFGADVTNICFKRNKVDSSPDGDRNDNLKLQNQIKVENAVTIADRSALCQDFSNSYQFGPLAPATVAKVGGSDNKATQTHDWDSFASTYRPQYHNQALRELFAHYMEAWKSWYTEVAGKKPIQQVS